MKKIAFLLPMLMIPFFMNAQKSPVDKLFDKYYGKEGFTTVLVTPDMFEMVVKMEKSSGEIEGMEILKKIKRVRVIAQEEESDVKAGVDFMDELKGVDFDDYKELVVVKEADQEVLILAKEEDGKLSELLVLVGGDENVLVSVEGRFTMEDLNALSDLDGLEALGGVLD
jgi:hypothetical protein